LSVEENEASPGGTRISTRTRKLVSPKKDEAMVARLKAEDEEKQRIAVERENQRVAAAASAAAVAASAGADLEEVVRLRRQFKSLSIQGREGSNPSRLFELLDKDGSGSLEFAEFRIAVRKQGKISVQDMSDAALRKLFRAMDLDAGGSIGVEELVQFLGTDEAPEFDTSATLGKESKDTSVSVLQKKKKTPYELKRDKVAADLQVLRKKLQAAAYGKGASKGGGNGVSYSGLFEHFDRDNSGELDFDEFRRAIRKEGKLKQNEWPDSQLRQLFRIVDADASGTITADEFVQWMGGDAPKDNAATRRRGAKAAKKVHGKDQLALDADIARLKRNFRAAAYHDGQQDLAALFRFYDRDNSGTIGEAEFRQAARKHGKVTAAKVSDAELAKLFALADEDGSGEIEVDEFVEFINRD
jgi:Ca2+-binding EF-hand superfamily protein